MFANKFNKTTFNVVTTGFKYVKLAELYNKNGGGVIFKIDAIYINHSKMGDQPIFVCADEKCMINIPSHKTATAREILADPEAVQAIRDGKVGITIYEYKSESYGKKCYSINFVDL